MATNLALDDDLLNEALALGGHRTKRDTVNEALLEYVQRRKQLRVVEAFGTIDFDPEHDYKAARRSRAGDGTKGPRGAPKISRRMSIIVDTCVWSAAFRRRAGPRSVEAREVERLIDDGRALMLGLVRQELLSGVRTSEQYELLRELLRSFPDLPIETEDHELAAAFSNACRARGIQGSAVDHLICAVAVRRGLAVYTTDRDFTRYAPIVGVDLFRPRIRGQPRSRGRARPGSVELRSTTPSRLGPA